LNLERAADDCAGSSGYHAELVTVIDYPLRLANNGSVPVAVARIFPSLATLLTPVKFSRLTTPFVLEVTSAEYLPWPSLVMSLTRATGDSTAMGSPVNVMSAPWQTTPHAPPSVALEKPSEGGCSFFRVA